MPHKNPPPLTTKKAKRLYQKSSKKFEFTASQFRAAERREELQVRRRKEEAKAERRKVNKRKREDKEERERAAKRQQLEEGKIRPEDTWAKVGASQSRLNAFFKKPALPAKKSPEEQEEEFAVDDDSEFESEDNAFADDLAQHIEEPVKEELEHNLSIGLTQPLSDSPPQTQRGDDTPNMKPKPHPSENENSQQDPVQTSHADRALLDPRLSSSQSFWDFVIAEDDVSEHPPDSAQPLPSCTPTCLHKTCTSPSCVMPSKPATPSPLKRKTNHLDESFLSSPLKSGRSALSEMSPSRVNIRAQEKPDTTSVPRPGSFLPSPDREEKYTAETPADIIAMISTQDLEDDELSIDKENTDPWQPTSNQNVPTKEAEFKSPSAIASGAQQPPKRVLTGNGELGNCEDFSDFDSEFDCFDDFDNGVDDLTLAGLSTQMPAKNTFVSAGGSPKKVRFTAEHNSSTIPLPTLARVSTATMLPPPCKLASSPRHQTRQNRSFTQTNSFPFDGVDDDDLADLAELLESDANSRAQGRAVIMRKSRVIPWLHPSQFPSPSQGGQEPLDSGADEDV
jgi:hypothetical protein